MLFFIVLPFNAQLNSRIPAPSGLIDLSFILKHLNSVETNVWEYFSTGVWPIHEYRDEKFETFTKLPTYPHLSDHCSTEFMTKTIHLNESLIKEAESYFLNFQVINAPNGW